MSGVSVSDLVFVVPELILVGTALALILAARRIRTSPVSAPVAAIATIVAALAAPVASGWLLARGGSTQTGFAGMIALDAYSQFFRILIAAALSLVALLSARSLDREKVPRGEYHALLLLAATGMTLAVSAQDLLALYLGLELMTICSYILVGITTRRPVSTEAAIKYFLIASFASALLLYGISLTYGITGGTDFAAVRAALSEHGGHGVHGVGIHPLLFVAIALVVAGIAFKIAAVPFHAWAPDAYQGASAPVAAFLAAGSKAAGLAVLGRVALVAFESEARVMSIALVTLAALSIVAGSIIALAQTDMKRLLAYSSIAHAGYALLGLASGMPEGVQATMTYTFFYVFMTLGTFGVVIALGERGETLDGYRGLAAQRPLAGGLMLLFLLALTGIPPTSGFVAKFVVILAAVRAGHVALAVLAVACSVVTAFVYMRVAVFMFMREPQEAEPVSWPAAVSAALAVAALVTLVGGILPGIVAPWAVAP
ncbi:MAG: NADH-quinone oxidoreductase subunit N [Thermoanaerobaculia bacterium]